MAHSTDRMTMSQTDRIARQFCRHTLPTDEWTHLSHLRVGLWHVLRYSPAEAMARLRDGIRTYNTACGVANSDSSGYHETITQVYVTLIAHFLATQDLSKPIDELATALILSLGEKELPLRYYSRERLMAPEARKQWVEPDLLPLPPKQAAGVPPNKGLLLTWVAWQGAPRAC